MKPFTNIMIKKTPMLYRGSPNVHSDDIDEALNGLKHDIIMIYDLSDDKKKLVINHINTWFPAFSKPEIEKRGDLNNKNPQYKPYDPIKES
jgi:hypothetical protein